MRSTPIFAIVTLTLGPTIAHGLTSPKQFLGFDVCQDYHLANYQQLAAYWKVLERESPRIKMVSIGKTEEGRDQFMLAISDPANLRNLDQIRKQNVQIGKGRLRGPALERALRSAKSVVWIDGGLHANEVLGAQQLIETAYQLASRDDAENRRILKDCVTLLVHANPDGMDLVSDWYMRNPVPEKRSLSNVPRMYQKYAGHDNNRDFYANNLAETRNMNHVLYHQWLPQILYNHHQSAPQGTIMFIPPFRSPFNYHMDPIVQVGTDLVGLHMHQRLIGEGKGGTVMRNGAPFSTWWNGGLRTTTYFHNMVGILTETFGSPNPVEVPFLLNRQIPSTDIPKPIEPGKWHLSYSLGYEISANYAILDYASRYRERLLKNMNEAAFRQTESGLIDTITRYPSRLTADGAKALTHKENRDAKAYVLPVTQDKDALELFLKRLWWTGIEIEKLTEDHVDRNNEKYEKGSYLIRCAQSFRPHILDMFEPQDHPNDLQYPGGPPIRPYDNAGYTLAYQMGIQFQRVLESAVMMKSEPASFESVPATGPNLSGAMGKIGLWDRYGGSMESGWTRWLFDRYQLNYDVLYPRDFDLGDLNQYNTIVLPHLAFPTPRALRPLTTGSNEIETDESIPFHFRRRAGRLTVEKTLPQLKKFVLQGGTIVAINGSAANLAEAWPELGWKNGLTEVGPNGNERELPAEKFFVPGSVLRVAIAQSELSEGYGKDLDILFDEGPAFVSTGRNSGTAVAMFNSEKPLRSGWAWGQEHLKGKAAIVDVPMGKGHVILSGAELNFRGQSHGSFKLLFNAFRRAARH